MAELVLSALLPVLFENIFNKLRSAFGKDIRLIQGVKEDLLNLEVAVKKFKHVLRDGEVKEFQSEDTRNWLRRLKYVANEADGILDDAIDSDNDNQSRVCFPFPHCFGFNRVAVRRNLGERIRSVTQKFDLLDSEKSTLDFGEIDMKRETISTSSEPKVFGRNEAREEIIQALLNGADIQTGGPPFVYAIVGFGGIGKTTLAQLIYNDQKVVDNFDPRLWVWISQTFDVKTAMRKLIETHSKEPCKLESLETMQNQLKELLNGKKFFIVLDDIWISDADLAEWNKFKSVLECGAIGSSVILTTRQSDVASLAGSNDRHNIALLSEDQSWFLFKESTFLEVNQKNGELEVIGKQIVRKCGGLPLAVKNLGGSLRSTRVVAEWESVRDSEIWELERPCNILPALKLSLIHLESHSRDCFAFSSLFPKGYKMRKVQLIHLWIANDLVPSHRRLDLEDMGNKILNELVLKSFFQISDNSFVTMHDLMHDLGRSFRDECFSLEGPDVSIVPPRISQLYLCYQDSLTPNILETLSKSHPSLHTCIVEEYNFSTTKIIFKNLDCLRALCLAYITLDNLPLSIGKSKHLKYLNLSGTNLTHLPDTICTLTKLQTLILYFCSKLTHLPDGIGQLINLRHLDLWSCRELTHLPDGISQMTTLRHLNIDECYNLTQLPSGMGKLVNLRMLGQFIVGREGGQRITELQGLKHLGGSLEIRGLEHVRDASEAREAVLKEKKNLSDLSLIWGYSRVSNNTNDEVEGVLEALQPPQSLNGKLVIQGYGGSVFPPLGQLPLLQKLTIKRMESIKCIGTNFYGGDGCTGSNSSGSERRRIFPSLESLEFEDMAMLEFSVDDFQNLISLKRLRVRGLPRVTSLPNLQYLSTLRELTISNCKNLRLWPQGMQNLRVLESLTVAFSEQLELSTGDFQHLVKLQRISLYGLNTLTSLPEDFQHLRSLKELIIACCQNLKTLSAWLQNLTSLQWLSIKGCHSDLPLRCEKDKGEYWPLISHIQEIDINEELW